TTVCWWFAVDLPLAKAAIFMVFRYKWVFGGGHATVKINL
ncbi:hypothetical protein A2U01_0031952, partial [Trifolium medium]|nr:hypothetical protein [Trifolium medium]